jgi:hypothetical protein
VNVLEVSHAAGSGGLAALGLLAPLERADLGGGVAARGAGVVLLVERAATAALAQPVGLDKTRLE